MKTTFAYLLVGLLFAMVTFGAGTGCSGGSGGSDGGTGITSGDGGDDGGNDGGTTGVVTGVSGHVRTVTGANAAGITIRFFDQSGAELTPVNTNSQGRFAAELPPSARRFSVSVDPGTYFVSFGYNGLEYSPSVSGCHAPLPTINQGQVSSLVADIVLTPRSELPPPAPSGCFPQ